MEEKERLKDEQCLSLQREGLSMLLAKELLNLINWLREQGFADDKIIECLRSVEGKKKILTDEE